jgi:hypothetical protein
MSFNINISTLEPGQTLFSAPLTVTPEAIDAYLGAVGDDADVYRAEGLAPPMAVAALVMTTAMQAVALPAGAVHTGQELEFTAPVALGSTLDCGATVAQNSVRRGTRFLTLEITGDVNGTRAVTGRISLAVAGQEE